MVGNIEIDFRNIRPLDGDKRKGFEELVCQLARREKNQEAREFRRIEGSGGDGGVEAYWFFKDGTEYGYQAKYFLAANDIDWSQIDKSVSTALTQHPKLTKYTIAVACDLTDRSGKRGTGKTGWEHWAAHHSKWEQRAKARGMTVEFVPWVKSDLIDRLIASTENRGLLLYWFDAHHFDQSWFRDHFERPKTDLAERFQPEDHVELRVKKTFDGLARSPDYLGFLSKWFSDVPNSNQLLTELNKLDSRPDRKLIRDLEERCIELHKIAESLDGFGGRPFPLTDWQAVIRSAFNTISPIRDWLWSQDAKDNQTVKQTLHSALNRLSEIDSHLDTTPIHLGENNPHEIRVEADSKRLLLVVGEAGTGKSHLLADAVTSSLNKNVPAILLLGQYFPGRDVRREFLNCLDLANHDFEKVLQALNAAAEATQRRLILFIDALNEAQSLRLWPNQLAGFVSDILRHEWLALCLSIRPEYESVLIPESIRKNAARLICRGIQSPEEQEQAAVQYFAKRGITRPAVPWLAPEFSNFLFLKTCCDSLQTLGINEFPRGLHGSLQVLKFYLDSLHSKLSRRFPEFNIPGSAIQNSARRLARSMAAARVDYVSMKLGTDICEDEFGSKGPDLKTTWFSVLVSEGLLRRDHVFRNKEGDPLINVDDIYRFTYQRFSDHLIAQALLEETHEIINAFQDGGPLNFLLEKNRFERWSPLWSALAVQIPEKFVGSELLDIVPNNVDEATYHYTLIEAFRQSLLWRSNSAFSQRTLELFNSLPADSSDSRIEILVRLATLRDHPWNAEFLDQNLQQRRLPERDALWTVQINRATEDDGHPIWQLIRWGLSSDLQRSDTEILRLAALTITWAFTSSACPLRDTATKALIVVFVNRPQLIPPILGRFREVDDLYVMERICASVLGTITRSLKSEDIKATAVAVYQAVFARETPYLNINLRDYARAVIEYAFQQGCLDESIDLKKSRPPYRSQWPLSEVSKEEVEAIAEKSGGKQIVLSAFDWGDFARHEIESKVRHLTSVPLNQPRPLNNEEREGAFFKELSHWAVEKQEAFAQLRSAVKEKADSLRMETGSGDNFYVRFSYPDDRLKQVQDSENLFVSMLSAEEKLLYEQLIMPVLMPDKVPHEDRCLPRFDTDFAKKWITKRAYEYGWSSKLFPDDHESYEGGRGLPGIERIGKKYQWLALFELMALLSDNVWAIDEWPERAIIYDHPAAGWFVRNIEPSLLNDPEPLEQHERWWQQLRLELPTIEDERLPRWPFEQEPLYTAKWMDVVSPDGTAWLLLYGFFIAHDNRENKDVSELPFRREIFLRVSTIIVDSDAVEATLNKLHGCRLADPSGHATIDWTDGPFLCEYPWRNTWRGRDIYEDGNIGNLPGIRYIRPVARHVWESQLDLSLKHRSSVYVANPWIANKLRLRPNLERPGELVSEGSNQPIFIDPTMGLSDTSAALINREMFFEFLKQEDLECLWIVAGEHNSWPSGSPDDYSCRSFASVYRWTGREWVGKGWHLDRTGTPGTDRL